MITTIHISESFLYDHGLRKRHAEEYQLFQKNIEKIKRIAFKQIRYPEFKEAYDYVDNFFPAANVKNTIIYKVAFKDLAKMGLAGAAGFCDPVTKIVVLSGAHCPTTRINRDYCVEAKVSNDEIIVHELCHYCYLAKGYTSVSREMMEEFAYGWSIGYLRQKGHSDEYIIKYNFLPYLVGTCSDNAMRKILAQNGITTTQYNSFSRYKKKEFNRIYGKKIFLMSKEMGMEQGWKLLELYSKKIESGEVYMKIEEEDDNDDDRYSMMDFQT